MGGKMESTRNKLFIGSFIYSVSLGELAYLHDTAVGVDATGKIVAVEPGCDKERAFAVLVPRLGWDAGRVEVTVCGKGQFFFPGFVGTFPLLFCFLCARRL
jgi:guanine deaminase